MIDGKLILVKVIEKGSLGSAGWLKAATRNERQKEGRRRIVRCWWAGEHTTHRFALHSAAGSLKSDSGVVVVCPLCLPTQLDDKLGQVVVLLLRLLVLRVNQQHRVRVAKRNHRDFHAFHARYLLRRGGRLLQIAQPLQNVQRKKIIIKI